MGPWWVVEYLNNAKCLTLLCWIFLGFLDRLRDGEVGKLGRRAGGEGEATEGRFLIEACDGESTRERGSEMNGKGERELQVVGEKEQGI